jgi:hypothetical protein
MVNWAGILDDIGGILLQHSDEEFESVNRIAATVMLLFIALGVVIATVLS